jgi:hypothetical protein
MTRAVEVAGVAKEEADVCDPLTVGVSEVDEAVGLAIQTRGLDAVAVPIAGEGEVTRIPEVKDVDRRT